ncbi:hypothetical protein JQU24_11710 [Ponticoccus sp. SC6-38]|nr:hypothetical protein [Ponticoccus sp. SC6-38]
MPASGSRRRACALAAEIGWRDVCPAIASVTLLVRAEATEAAPWEAVPLLAPPRARIVAERMTLVLTGSDMTARNLNMIRKLSDRAQPGLDWDGRTC